jgi:cytoskeletal protein RodZ
MTNSTNQPMTPQPQQMPPMQPMQPVQAQKKPIYKRVWFWIVIVLAAIVIAQMVGGQNSKNTNTTPAKSETSQQADQKPKEETVEIQATSSGEGTVIWGEAGSSNTEKFQGTWNKTITGEDAKKGYTVSVTGDFMGGNDQKVTCTVLVNGQQKSHKEGSGQAGSAMCDTYGIFK